MGHYFLDIQYMTTLTCVCREVVPILCSKLLCKTGHYFLDIQYTTNDISDLCVPGSSDLFYVVS